MSALRLGSEAEAGTVDAVTAVHLAGEPDWPQLGEALCALGCVLCVHPSAGDSRGVTACAGATPWPGQPELDGLVRATRIEAVVRVGSDGPREGLWFLGADDRVLYGIVLLPDSDYLAWEHLLSRLTPVAPARGNPGWCQRLLGRMHRYRGLGGSWHAGARRFRLDKRAGMPVLDVEAVLQLSHAARSLLRVVAGEAGVQLDPAARRCCCEQAFPFRSAHLH